MTPVAARVHAPRGCRCRPVQGGTTELIKPEEEQLYRRVTQILGDARGRVARTVNAEMVNAYWRIGREIVEVEQAGQARGVRR